MSRRRLVLGAGVVSVVLVAGGSAVAMRDGGGTSTGTDGATSAATGATAEVTRRDLEEYEEVSGTLGYGETRQVTLSGGTLTALPALGSVIDRGGTVAEVDGRPVPLLFGARPLWRSLDAGAVDGPDIQQIEENLVALGYATSDSLTVDQDWTSATTEAVEDWQEALGRDRTGTVAPGDVAIQPGAVRVADWPTPVGGPAGGAVLTVSGTTPVVDVDLDATMQSQVTADQAVEVVLPDESTTPGRITSIGTVADGEDTDQDGIPDSFTVDVQVTLDDPAAAGSLDSAPVAVRIVTRAAEGVLAVPVDALLAVADGGYVVEKVGRNGATHRVRVETGAFADGWVQVTGDVAEGDEVVVPG